MQATTYRSGRRDEGSLGCMGGRGSGSCPLPLPPRTRSSHAVCPGWHPHTVCAAGGAGRGGRRERSCGRWPLHGRARGSSSGRAPGQCRACPCAAELAAARVPPGQPGRPVQRTGAGRAGARGGGGGRRRGAGPVRARAAGPGGRQAGAAPPAGVRGAARGAAQPGPAQRHAGPAAGDRADVQLHPALRRVPGVRQGHPPGAHQRQRQGARRWIPQHGRLCRRSQRAHAAVPGGALPGRPSGRQRAPGGGGWRGGGGAACRAAGRRAGRRGSTAGAVS